MTSEALIHEAVTSETLSPPIGAYSHAIRAGQLLFISGQVAFGPDGAVVGVGDMAAQVAQVFANLDAVLAAAGADRGNLTHLTIYVVDMDGRAEVSKARAEYVVDPKPASTLVGVNRLAHPDLLVEIDAIAVLGP
jgi:reactive intermediate/imine deaminase